MLLIGRVIVLGRSLTTLMLLPERVATAPGGWIQAPTMTPSADRSENVISTRQPLTLYFRYIVARVSWP